MSSTTVLDLKFSITPTTLIDLERSGSYSIYPYLRFYI